MRTYKITLTNNETETIKATGYRDVDGKWIDFVDGGGQLLRLRAEFVMRIDVEE